MNQKLTDLEKELAKKADPIRAKNLSRFFKTGKGEYGEGDVFLGITVPIQRSIASRYLSLSLSDLQKLLNSKIHEHRLCALIILVNQFKKSDAKRQKEIADFYLKNTKNINNWDLVDLSAAYILGSYFENRDKSIFFKLAKSKNVWERRISVLSTFHFIKNKDFKEILEIAEMLLLDTHDLIHKAVGWMLREVGKKDQKALEKFLQKYHARMPRTMLRYAIERFEESKRKFYLLPKN